MIAYHSLALHLHDQHTFPPTHNEVGGKSRLYRWRQWFAAWAVYAVGCLYSIALRFWGPMLGSSAPTHSALHRIGHFVGNAPEWLARVVRPIANLRLWIHTRSVF